MMTEEEKAEIRKIVRVATEETIIETFKVLGIDINDFGHISEFRDNHTWVKKYRETSESVGSRVLITLATIATGGVATAIWAFIQSRGD